MTVEARQKVKSGSWFFGSLICFIIGLININVERRREEAVYKKYLGKDYVIDEFDKEKYSLIISNHVSWLVSFNLR